MGCQLSPGRSPVRFGAGPVGSREGAVPATAPESEREREREGVGEDDMWGRGVSGKKRRRRWRVAGAAAFGAWAGTRARAQLRWAEARRGAVLGRARCGRGSWAERGAVRLGRLLLLLLCFSFFSNSTTPL